MSGSHRRPVAGLPPWPVATTWAAAAVVALAALGWTAWHGVSAPGTAAAFGVLIAIGVAVRAALPGEEREAAPLVAAGALAYALLPAAGGAPQAVALVTVAMLAGAVRHEALGRAWSGGHAAGLLRARTAGPGTHRRVSSGRLREAVRRAWALSGRPQRTAAAASPGPPPTGLGSGVAVSGLGVAPDLGVRFGPGAWSDLGAGSGPGDGSDPASGPGLGVEPGVGVRFVPGAGLGLRAGSGPGGGSGAGIGPGPGGGSEPGAERGPGGGSGLGARLGPAAGSGAGTGQPGLDAGPGLGAASGPGAGTGLGAALGPGGGRWPGGGLGGGSGWQEEPAAPDADRPVADRADAAARLVLTTAFAATCFQPLQDSGPGPLHALWLFILLGLTAACDAVLAAALAAARTRHPYAPVLRDELRALPGIGAAVCAGGVVLALSVDAVGLWALPVFSVPLLLTQVSFRRHTAIRATYRQTIASLARCTEVAGYTPAGHARRVSALSRAVGRELGMAGRDLLTLEYAALMHDIGQLSLLDPVPAGATEPLDAEEQRRIALLGGAVVRHTGAPEDVAVIVERQADPYREQPIAGRIVRTVNAYEDLAGTTGARGIAPGLQALERLRLATAYEYDPRVVEALTRVVARAGH